VECAPNLTALASASLPCPACGPRRPLAGDAA